MLDPSMPVLVAEPPPGWYAAADPTKMVTVRLDAAAEVVQVDLKPGWRIRVGVPGLGRVVTAATAAALLDRTTAWATRPARHPLAAPGPSTASVASIASAGVTGGGHITGLRGEAPAQRVTAVLRARRDVAEFALRLTELHASPAPASSPCGRVRIVVVDGRVDEVVVDEDWAHTVDDPTLRAVLGRTLGAALQAGSALAGQALAGCPDLQDLLASSGQLLPDEDAVPGRWAGGAGERS